MALPLATALVLVVAIALFVWWLAMLIEALRFPTSRWDETGQSQLVHVLVMVVLGVIGTIVYMVVARPKLRG